MRHSIVQILQANNRIQERSFWNFGTDEQSMETVS